MRGRRSVDSGRAGRGVESRKAQCSGGRRGCRHGRQHRCVKTQGRRPGTSAHRLRRDLRARHVSKGCPGTWEISSSPGEKRTIGHSVPQTRGLRAWCVARAGAFALCAEEHEHDAHTRCRQAKETKRGGKDDEKSERRSRSDEVGELTRRTPRSKGWRRKVGTVRGNDGRDFELINCLNKT